jgi:alanine dehydrogenase
MSDSKKSNPVAKALAQEALIDIMEQPKKVSTAGKSLVIGVPSEIAHNEKRICLTPESVGVLVNNGIQVVVQSGAGEASHFSDRLYNEKGAKIEYSAEAVFKSDIVLKLNPPTLEEIEYMNPGSTLMSALQRSQLKVEFINHLNKKKITAVGFELIEDKGGLKPVVRSLSEIASNCIISIAGECLSNVNGGQGIMFGGVTGVPPLKIVILGAGTIGENVCRIARQMGAEVRVFDNQHYKLRRLKKDLADQVYTSMIDNYTLAHELKEADVVIGCLRSEEGQSMCVVSEDMVMNMKKGSVIIDASISQGGCFETSRITSHDNPTFVKHDVVHYCVPNIPSRVSRTASRALSYLFTPMLIQMNRIGGVEPMIQDKSWFMKGVYTYRGCLTNQNLARIYNLDYKDLNLFFATRF